MAKHIGGLSRQATVIGGVVGIIVVALLLYLLGNSTVFSQLSRTQVVPSVGSAQGRITQINSDGSINLETSQGPAVATSPANGVVDRNGNPSSAASLAIGHVILVRPQSSLLNLTSDTWKNLSYAEPTSVNPPVISNVSPNPISVGGIITITGTNFTGQPTTATINYANTDQGVNLQQVNRVSSTSIRATVPSDATLGTHELIISTGSRLSNSLPITVTAAPAEPLRLTHVSIQPNGPTAVRVTWRSNIATTASATCQRGGRVTDGVVQSHPGTSHFVAFTGLARRVNYFCQAVSTDPSGRTAASSLQTVRTQ